jgi:glycosyltransferase involved in cell wall biosynthesis
VKIIFIDSTAAASTGPGSPAYFSRYLLTHLRAHGHDVEVLSAFAADACSRADAVVTEWVDANAYEAAAAGVCKRLILRMRGYEVFGPLAQLEWSNVDALVFESHFLATLAKEHGALAVATHVIPSGVDVATIPFKERGYGSIVAMVGRGVADKGYQLAFEWARQRSDIELHVAITLPEPRLLRYLQYTKPNNVVIHHNVQTVTWLDQIGANYLLSASNWESLGYTIAEAMACGVVPLVHDTPGARENWPTLLPWRSLNDLDRRKVEADLNRRKAEASFAYSNRAFVEEHFDAVRQSTKFAALIASIPARTHSTHTIIADARTRAQAALRTGDLDAATAAVTRFRSVASARSELVDDRVGCALLLAGTYHATGDYANARVWTLRALVDGARPDALCLLGEIAVAEGDIEGALRWYEAASAVDPVPSRYTDAGLVNGRHDRLAAIRAQR